MKKNNLIIMVITGIVIAAGAFFGGMKYQQSQAASGSRQFARNGTNGIRARTGGNGGATVGEIISQDANSITVKLQDGSSKIIILSNSTTYSKTDTASKSDLKTGARVAAFGTSNSDGSITAQNIQLNPMFRAGPTGQPRASQ